MASATRGEAVECGRDRLSIPFHKNGTKIEDCSLLLFSIQYYRALWTPLFFSFSFCYFFFCPSIFSFSTRSFYGQTTVCAWFNFFLNAVISQEVSQIPLLPFLCNGVIITSVRVKVNVTTCMWSLEMCSQLLTATQRRTFYECNLLVRA